jgi:type VI protein secretion system component VasK
MVESHAQAQMAQVLRFMLNTYLASEFKAHTERPTRGPGSQPEPGLAILRFFLILISLLLYIK